MAASLLLPRIHPPQKHQDLERGLSTHKDSYIDTDGIEPADSSPTPSTSSSLWSTFSFSSSPLPSPVSPSDPHPHFLTRLTNLLTFLFPRLTVPLTSLATRLQLLKRPSRTTFLGFSFPQARAFSLPSPNQIPRLFLDGLQSPLLPLTLVCILAAVLTCVAGWSLLQNLTEIPWGNIMLARRRELFLRCVKGSWSCDVDSNRGLTGIRWVGWESAGKG